MSTLKVNTIESIIHSNNKVLGSTDSATGSFNFPNPMPVTDSHHKGHVVQFHHYTVHTKNDQGVLIDVMSQSDTEDPKPVTFTPFREINVLPTNYLHLTISFVLKIKAPAANGRSFGTVYLNRVTGASSLMEDFNPDNILTKITYDAADTNAESHRTQPVTIQYVDKTPPSYPMYGLYVVNRLDYDDRDIQRTDPALVDNNAAFGSYGTSNIDLTTNLWYRVPGGGSWPKYGQGRFQYGPLTPTWDHNTNSEVVPVVPWNNPPEVTVNYTTSWSVTHPSPMLHNGYDYQIESTNSPTVIQLSGIDYYHWRARRRTFEWTLGSEVAMAEVKSSQGVTFIFQEIQQ